MNPSCRATRDAKKYETALAEQRGRAEAEKEGLLAAAANAEERHAAVQATIARQDQELQNYKVCLLPLSGYAPATVPKQDA